MTDTAVPLPETEAVPDDGSMLTADQRRRVEALQVARQILENKPGLFAGSKLEPARSVVTDLTYLADWIINGPDSDDRVELLTGSGERVASISTRTGQWADTYGSPPVDDHDAAATVDDLGPYPDENNGPGNP